MTNPKDYNVLARAVPCGKCGALVGERCHGARGGWVEHAHHVRRRLAAEMRRKQRKETTDG